VWVARCTPVRRVSLQYILSRVTKFLAKIVAWGGLGGELSYDERERSFDECMHHPPQADP